MQIRIGFDIITRQKYPTPMVLLLNVRPELTSRLVSPDTLKLEPDIPIHSFVDTFGNTSLRIVAPVGLLHYHVDTIIEDDGKPDVIMADARQHPIEDLPDECLPFLLNSRYCEVDKLSGFAWEKFGQTQPGWERVQAICDFVHQEVRFGYEFARATKTAVDVLEEKTGVCRDFQHLALTFCRCLGIPARYATGYLSQIQARPTGNPMDFSAWFQVYLSGQWYDFDARFNTPRIGRLLMAVGRDATDCALITSFGTHSLERFVVITEEAGK